MLTAAYEFLRQDLDPLEDAFGRENKASNRHFRAAIIVLYNGDDKAGVVLCYHCLSLRLFFVVACFRVRIVVTVTRGTSLLSPMHQPSLLYETGGFKSFDSLI